MLVIIFTRACIIEWIQMLVVLFMNNINCHKPYVM